MGFMCVFIYVLLLFCFGRIYLEEELIKVCEWFKLWKDMYKKMLVVDFVVFIEEEYV